MGNAVAALSLQLIVGVVLGSPDARAAGVNTWHFILCPPGREYLVQETGHMSTPPVLPPPVRFWLQ